MNAGAAAQKDATVSGRLAQHVVSTRVEDIPVAALESSKRLALDTLAVAWAGSSAPGVREACELLREEGGNPEAIVWAFGGKLPARAAAFINSPSAAALDSDAMRARSAAACIPTASC